MVSLKSNTFITILNVICFCSLFTRNIFPVAITHAFPTTQAITQDGVFLCSPYAGTAIVPCSWNVLHLVTIPDKKLDKVYRSTKEEAAPELILTNTDPNARFNIHLYLDHTWHLNLGFSK